MIDLQLQQANFRRMYPVLERYTYLNTANSGLLSTAQKDWRGMYDQLFVDTGSKFRDDIIAQMSGVRDTIGRVFDIPDQHTALVPNFSWGINAIAEALSASLKVLTIQNDYASLTKPFDSRGFEVVQVPLFDLSEAGIATRIKDLQVDVLAISMTQWISGITFSQDFFERLRVDFPDLLIIVDGTQSLGTAPFSFRESGIDILITSAYKWLLGGYGCGFVACTDRALDQLAFKVIGSATLMVRKFSGVTFPMQVLEPGHIDFLALYTMQMGLEALEEVGLTEVERHISKVSLHAKSQLVNMGMLSPTALGGRLHRGIIHLITGERLVQFLQEHGVVVSYRDGLRLSIHYYNTEQDINRLLSALRVFR